MKKLLVLVLVLAMASLASADFLITVDGETVSEITVAPSDDLVLGLFGVDNDGWPMAFYMLVQGPGVSSGGVSLYGGALDEVRTQTTAEWSTEFEWENSDVFADFGFEGVTTATMMTLASTVAPSPFLNGQLVDEILFHCEGTGTVTLTLILDDLETVLGTVTITQIPEPATIALLCLGGLLIRKK